MKIQETSYDYIVLGGGVAGLSFAHEVAQQGASVLVLEKESEVGGLCRTLQWKGHKFDFSTHRLAGKSQHVLERIQAMLGEDLIEHHDQKSRIFLFRKYMRYPFNILEVIKNFKWHDQLLITFSYLNARVKNILLPREVENYKEWFCQRYGNKLYNIMCKPYTSKIWKCDPEKISSDWADRRFPQEHLFQILIKILKNDFLKKKTQVAPDTGVFYYPKHGFQQIPMAFEKEIKDMEQTVLTNAELKAIRPDESRVLYTHDEKEFSAYARKAIISTIPLTSYLKLIPSAPEDIQDKAQKLRYLDIILVYFLFDRPQITSDHWLYFADHDIIFNRVVEFKNWSKEMAPMSKTSLCVDITCSDGNHWNLSDEELKRKCLEGMTISGMAKKEDISDAKVIRVPYAYPVYDLNYKENLYSVVNYIESSNKVFTLGRTGMFRYNNSHYSIEMGIELAKRLQKGDYRSIHDYDLQNSV